jgi:hypothetical protein
MIISPDGPVGTLAFFFLLDFDAVSKLPGLPTTAGTPRPQTGHFMVFPADLSATRNEAPHSHRSAMDIWVRSDPGLIEV